MVVLYNSATLCHVMPCYAMLCRAMPHYAISDYYQKFSKKIQPLLNFITKISMPRYATASRCHLLRYAALVPHIHYHYTSHH